MLPLLKAFEIALINSVAIAALDVIERKSHSLSKLVRGVIKATDMCIGLGNQLTSVPHNEIS